MKLIIEQESFPVELPEAQELILILRGRDWLRECFQLLFQEAGVPGCALKTSKGSKQNKVKIKRATSRLMRNGKNLAAQWTHLERSTPSLQSLNSNLNLIIGILQQRNNQTDSSLDWARDIFS